MDLRYIGSVALLAVMAVAALFFFPAAHGPYSSTHGPATALRSFRLRAFLLFLIAATAAALTSLVPSLKSLGRSWFGPSSAITSGCVLPFSPLRR